jgi:hypothetical protein
MTVEEFAEQAEAAHRENQNKVRSAVVHAILQARDCSTSKRKLLGIDKRRRRARAATLLVEKLF